MYNYIYEFCSNQKVQYISKYFYFRVFSRITHWKLMQPAKFKLFEYSKLPCIMFM